MEQSAYLKRQEQVRQFNANNRWKKRGIAIIPTKFGMSFTIKSLNQVLSLHPLSPPFSDQIKAGALVHVYTDGTVLVTHGGTEMGQGLHTKMAQIAAKVLHSVHLLVT
jgi:xanthine dehydrogenase/oxidase